MTAERCLWIAGGAAAAVAVGFAGASAFNPDSGWLWHATALWQIFGIAVYAGAFVFPLALLAAAALALRGRR